jgi:hypothetical protein
LPRPPMSLLPPTFTLVYHKQYQRTDSIPTAQCRDEKVVPRPRHSHARRHIPAELSASRPAKSV